MSVEVPDMTAARTEVVGELDAIEARLMHLIRQGGESRALEDILDGLSSLVSGIGLQYRRILELLDRRDLTYGTTHALEDLRRRTLWLYRKVCMETIFFTKLRLERSLRDAIYKMVVETYEELSTLENEERSLMRMVDEGLSARLLNAGLRPRADDGPPPED
jgi:hypothetical protein